MLIVRLLFILGVFSFLGCVEDTSWEDEEFSPVRLQSQTFDEAGTSGGFSVGNNGSANYQVGIQVPLGRLSPSLSIAYNSNAGNGLLGRGFSLTGLSRITKCNRTEHVDGYNLGDDGRETPVYCLDGQRLLKSDEKSKEGKDIFKTQTLSPLKIQFISCPDMKTLDCFKVETGSGITKTYHPIILEPYYIQWVLRNVKDEFGHQQEINYQVKGTEYYPTSIKYGDDNVNVIEFAYEDRNKVDSQYYRGREIKLSQRLASITTKKGNQIFASYVIDYLNDSSEDWVSSITQCTGSGSSQKCLRPIEFSWADDSSATASLTNKINITQDCKHTSGTETVMYNWSDVDGDGVKDLHCNNFVEHKIHGGIFSGFFRIASGVDLGEPQVRLLKINPESSQWSVSNWQNITMPNGLFCNQASLESDIDGDGRMDILCLGGENGSASADDISNPHRLYGLLSRGDSASGLRFEQIEYEAFDRWCYDEDKLASMKMSDLNQDGRADLLCENHRTKEIELGFSQGSTGIGDYVPGGKIDGASDGQGVATLWCDDSRESVHLTLLDFDGNGTGDLACHDSETGEVRIKLGTQKLVEPGRVEVEYSSFDNVSHAFCQGSTRKLVFDDLNHDGLDDLLCADRDSGEIKVEYSVGAGLFAPEQVLINADTSIGAACNNFEIFRKDKRNGYRGSESTDYLFVADLNGDGRKDFICSDSQGRHTWMLPLPNRENKNLFNGTQTCSNNDAPDIWPDIDNNGYADFHCLVKGSGQTLQEHYVIMNPYMPSESSAKGKIISISNRENAVAVEISYSRLNGGDDTYSPFYQPLSDESQSYVDYPMKRLVSGLSLVSSYQVKHKSIAHLFPLEKYEYHYQEGIVDVSRGGFQGFRVIEKTRLYSDDSKVVVRQLFNLLDDESGTLQRTTSSRFTAQGSEHKLSDTKYEYASLGEQYPEIANVNGKPVNVSYLREVRQNTYNKNNELLSTSSATYRDMTDFGAPKKVIKVKDGHRIATHCVQYHPTIDSSAEGEESYYVGYPVSRSVVEPNAECNSSGTQVWQKSEITYNSDMLPVSVKNIVPDNSLPDVEKTFSYDDKGRVVTITENAHTNSPFITKYFYYGETDLVKKTEYGPSGSKLRTSSTLEYDEISGAVLSVTTPLKIKSRWEYDAFYRLRKEYGMNVSSEGNLEEKLLVEHSPADRIKRYGFTAPRYGSHATTYYVNYVSSYRPSWASSDNQTHWSSSLSSFNDRGQLLRSAINGASSESLSINFEYNKDGFLQSETTIGSNNQGFTDIQYGKENEFDPIYLNVSSTLTSFGQFKVNVFQGSMYGNDHYVAYTSPDMGQDDDSDNAPKAEVRSISNVTSLDNLILRAGSKLTLNSELREALTNELQSLDIDSGEYAHASLGAKGELNFVKYSPRSRKVVSIDPIGEKTEVRYDAYGRVLSTEDSTRGLITHEYYTGHSGYLPQGVTTTTGSHAVVTKYPKGNKVVSVHDEWGQLSRMYYFDAGDDLDSSFWFQYGSDGSTQGRVVHVSAYRGDGVAKYEKDFGYDEWGRIKTKKFKFNRDSLNEAMHNENFDKGLGEVSFHYGDSSFKVSYADGKSFEETYNVNGQLNKRVFKASNGSELMSAEYSDYTSFGVPKTVTYGNGVVERYLFDSHGRLFSYKVHLANGMKVIDRSYKFANGKLREIVDHISSSYSENFRYDASGQLIYAEGPYPSIFYTYDLSGRRMSKETRDASKSVNDPVASPVNTIEYRKDKPYHLAASYWGSSYKHYGYGKLEYSMYYEYDENGNLSKIQSQSDNSNPWYRGIYPFKGIGFNYTANNRISSVSFRNQIRKSFDYDENGSRWYKKDLDEGLEKINLGSGVTEIANIRYPSSKDRLYAVPGLGTYKQSSDGGSEVLYTHMNHIGSATVTTNNYGQQKGQTYIHRPFGETYSGELHSDSKEGFQGYEEDIDKDYYNGISLQYANHRSYLPHVGAFNRPDDAGQYSNPYSAFGNDPVNRIDPTGDYAVGAGHHGHGAATFRHAVTFIGSALLDLELGFFVPETSALLAASLDGLIGGVSGGFYAFANNDGSTGAAILEGAVAGGIGGGLARAVGRAFSEGASIGRSSGHVGSGRRSAGVCM